MDPLMVPDAAGDRRATDEDGGDRVQLPADAVLRPGGRRTGHEDHAGQGGQDPHVHHHEEVDPLEFTPDSSAARVLPPTA